MDYIWTQEHPNVNLVNVFNVPISEYTDSDHTLLGAHIDLARFIVNNYAGTQYDSINNHNHIDGEQHNNWKIEYDKITKKHWNKFTDKIIDQQEEHDIESSLITLESCIGGTTNDHNATFAAQVNRDIQLAIDDC